MDSRPTVGIAREAATVVGGPSELGCRSKNADVEVARMLGNPQVVILRSAKAGQLTSDAPGAQHITINVGVCVPTLSNPGDLSIPDGDEHIGRGVPSRQQFVLCSDAAENPNVVRN